jgi:membrane protease YdiL (CAAX protease family)
VAQEDGQGTVDEVVRILSPNPLSYLNLLAVTGVLAPVLEEYVFR